MSGRRAFETISRVGMKLVVASLTATVRGPALVVIACLSIGGGANSVAAQEVVAPSGQETARDVGQRINDANSRLRAGDPQGAHDALRELGRGPYSDVADYNRALTLVARGESEAASQLFEQLASSDDERVAARSRYNLGNVRYQQARVLAEHDKQAAIRQVESAIDAYRGSLRIRGQDSDARANIEISARFLDELRRPEEEPPEQDQSDDQQQPDQDQSPSQDSSEQDSEDQPSESDESDQQRSENEESNQDESEGQPPSQQDQQGENEGSGADPRDDQSAPNDSDTRPEQSQSSPSDESPSAEEDQAGNETRTGDENQSDQQESDPDSTDASDPNPEGPGAESDRTQDGSQDSTRTSSSDPSGTPDSDQAVPGEQEAGSEEGQSEQPSTAGELTADDAAEPSGDSAAMSGGNSPARGMTEDEARKMLQAIRDRDMLRRYQLDAAERSRRRFHVDRDW